MKKKPYKIRQIVFHAVSTCHSIVFGLVYFIFFSLTWMFGLACAYLE